MPTPDWYTLATPDLTDSPTLLVYPQRVRENIQEMVNIAGNAQRLVPHVKTHKMPEVVKLQMEAGIHRFKCATIAEAEMLAMTGAKDILLAYQLNVSKAHRYLQLIKQFPEILFASLIDNMHSAQMLNKVLIDEGLDANVYIDIDDGMHRTGFPAEGDIVSFYQQVNTLLHIHCRGLHVYDGHFHNKDFSQRKELAATALQPVMKAVDEIAATGLPVPEVIAGGSPTFSVHALDPGLLCSPGTCLLWDWGYANKLTEQHFQFAAVLLTRIISKPMQGRITTDLGHKSVAAENPIDKRIFFLNLNNYKAVSQSEEHLVLEVGDEEWKSLKPGDVLYGIPYHICPTVALYDEAQVVEDGKATKQWQISGRKKKINI